MALRLREEEMKIKRRTIPSEWKMRFALVPLTVAEGVDVWLEFYEVRYLPGGKIQRRLPGAEEFYESYLGDEL